jgi:hypothetical protein
MSTFDTAQLAPAAAASNPRLRQKLARVTVATGGDTEATVELAAHFDKPSAGYRAYLVRTVRKTNPATGAVSLVNDRRRGATCVVLNTVRAEWAEERLDALYAQAFESMVARLAAGDEKVAAILG